MTVSMAFPESRRILERLRAWSRRVGLYRLAAFALTVAAVLSGSATVGRFSGR